RIIGVGRFLACLLGLSYAFLPYVFIRNVGHLNLVHYLVPLLCLFAYAVAGGMHAPSATWAKRLGYGACIAQGFNYIYFSYFAVAIFVFAALYAVAVRSDYRSVKSALVACAILMGSTALNLAPTFA